MSEIAKLLESFFQPPKKPRMYWLTGATSHEMRHPRRNGECLHTTFKRVGADGSFTAEGQTLHFSI